MNNIQVVKLFKNSRSQTLLGSLIDTRRGVSGAEAVISDVRRFLVTLASPVERLFVAGSLLGLDLSAVRVRGECHIVIGDGPLLLLLERELRSRELVSHSGSRELERERASSLCAANETRSLSRLLERVTVIESGSIFL